MTAVAGLVHQGRVHLGADSAGLAGWALTIRADPKVFRNGPYVLGFTSSFRMGQLLHHAFTPPTPPPARRLDRFMATEFIDAVRECLKAGGYATKNSEAEAGGNFLVGVTGRLFEIGQDYQVGEPADEVAAVGCGFELCLGALYATRQSAAPRRRLTVALEAAEHFNGGVRGPFTFASTGRPS